MSKEAIAIDGRVSECLPNATFRVKVLLRDKELVVLAHLSGKIRINNINICTGDKVKLEVSPYDLTRGRITYRYKD